MLTRGGFVDKSQVIRQRRMKTNLSDNADVHVATTAQVVEYTRANGLSNQLNPFIPLEDIVTKKTDKMEGKNTSEN